MVNQPEAHNAIQRTRISRAVKLTLGKKEQNMEPAAGFVISVFLLFAGISWAMEQLICVAA